MNMLTYKGYLGSVAYSEKDCVFYGKIEGIDGLVNYEGTSVAELTTAFQEAVEDYLSFCKEHHLEPQKSYSGSFNIRVAPELHRALALCAVKTGLSLNAFVKQILSRAVGMESPTVNAYLLQEPGVPYGKSMQLRIPSQDRSLAESLAGRMGWEITSGD